MHISKISPVLFNMVEYRINTSISRVESNKSTITKVAKKYGVPKEIIGGIIFKEQLTQSLPDTMVNADTYFRNEYHSTGLGAVFPGTARAAWSEIDSTMVYGLTDRELQFKLSNDKEFNINTIAAVLVNEAIEEKIIKIPSEAKNLTRQR